MTSFNFTELGDGGRISFNQARDLFVCIPGPDKQRTSLQLMLSVFNDI